MAKEPPKPALPSVLSITLDKKEMKKKNEEDEAEEENNSEKKKKPKRKASIQTPRLTKEEKEFSTQVQQAHLLSLFGTFFISSFECDDPLLQSLILSILPSIHIPSKKHLEDHESFLKWVSALTMWWSGTFTLVDDVRSLRTYKP